MIRHQKNLIIAKFKTLATAKHLLERVPDGAEFVDCIGQQYIKFNDSNLYPYSFDAGSYSQNASSSLVDLVPVYGLQQMVESLEKYNSTFRAGNQVVYVQPTCPSRVFTIERMSTIDDEQVAYFGGEAWYGPVDWIRHATAEERDAGHRKEGIAAPYKHNSWLTAELITQWWNARIINAAALAPATLIDDPIATLGGTLKAANILHHSPEGSEYVELLPNGDIRYSKSYSTRTVHTKLVWEELEPKQFLWASVEADTPVPEGGVLIRLATLKNAIQSSEQVAVGDIVFVLADPQCKSVEVIDVDAEGRITLLDHFRKFRPHQVRVVGRKIKAMVAS